MGRQKQIEQVWVNEDDRQNAEVVAEYLTSIGYDLKSTAPNAVNELSYTKLMRALLQREAAIIRIRKP